MNTVLLRTLILLSLSSSLMSQETSSATPPPAETAEAPQELDAIVVTADAEPSPFAPPAVGLGLLGERGFVDIPFSIQRYDRALMEKQHVRSIRDILINDAAVLPQTTASSYANTVNIRGFEANTFLYDGLSGPISTQPDFPIFLIESADVLKGPSSLIYGGSVPFGGVGGLVNFNPKRAPGHGEADIRRLTLGWQNRNLGYSNLDLGGRFGEEEKFGYRLNFGGEYGEGVARNNDIRDYYIGLSLEWEATDWLKLTTDFGHIRLETNGYQDTLSIPDFDLPAAPDPSLNYSLPWNYYRTESDYGMLRADITFSDDWSLEIAGIYSENVIPYAGGAAMELQNTQGDILIAPGWYDPYGESWSLRGNLKGKFETLGLKHNVSLSARYDGQEGGGPFGNFNAGPFTSNIYDPASFPDNEPQRLPASGAYFFDYAVTSFQITDFIELHPMLTLLVGGGYVNIEEKLQGYEQNAFTPIGAVIFKPWEKTSFYVGYGEALEQGGIAPIGTSNVGQALPPKESAQVEAGIRHQWERINLGLSFYKIDRTLEIVNSSNAFVQDGEQTHHGVELSLGGDLTDDFSLLASVSYIDSEVNGADPVTRGNAAPGVPEFALRLFAEYRFADWLPGFAVNGGFNYKSSQYLSAANDRSIPAYHTFDMGVSYDFRPKFDLPAHLRVSVENLADERYYSSVSFGGFGLGVGDARTVKVSLQIDF